MRLSLSLGFIAVQLSLLSLKAKQLSTTLLYLGSTKDSWKISTLLAPQMKALIKEIQSPSKVV